MFLLILKYIMEVLALAYLKNSTKKCLTILAHTFLSVIFLLVVVHKSIYDLPIHFILDALIYVLSITTLLSPLITIITVNIAYWLSLVILLFITMFNVNNNQYAVGY